MLKNKPTGNFIQNSSLLFLNFKSLSAFFSVMWSKVLSLWFIKKRHKAFQKNLDILLKLIIKILILHLMTIVFPIIEYNCSPYTIAKKLQTLRVIAERFIIWRKKYQTNICNQI